MSFEFVLITCEVIRVMAYFDITMVLTSGTFRIRKLDGQNRLPEIIQGIEFRDGIRQLQAAA